jgi:hypothetical protein
VDKGLAQLIKGGAGLLAGHQSATSMVVNYCYCYWKYFEWKWWCFEWKV